MPECKLDTGIPPWTGEAALVASLDEQAPIPRADDLRIDPVKPTAFH